MTLRRDGFLGGRLSIAQPTHGYRAGADAVMLGAACPAQPGDEVLELGCGAGVALLCLGARVAGLGLTGIERDPLTAALAADNAAANGMAAQIVTGDIAAMPALLRSRSFGHVIANPPFFAGGTPAPHAARAAARHEETPLETWIDAALRRLTPRGTLTLIHRAEALDRILAALSPRAGDIAILPIAARTGRPAGRVIVKARKGAHGPLRLLAPFIMHEQGAHTADQEDLSTAAQAVLRYGKSLPITAVTEG